MNFLLQILPANLQIQLTRFIYKDIIEKIPFLKNRSDRFYLQYLDKLKPMRFDPYQLIWDKDQKAKEVFFIIDGIIHNEENDRVLNSGMMFG
jgi:hypothetical protein